MRFSIFTWLLTATLLAAGCTRPLAPPSPVSSSSAPATAGSGYNVVLVSFDAMRARETSLYGYTRDTTPHLKRFAEGAVVFENAIAPASWTLPATMSIFTGLYPSNHGVVNKLTTGPDGKIIDAQLAPQVTTLPQLLHRAGYVLGAFTGDAGVSARFGFGRDFDAFLDDEKFGGFVHSMPAAKAWLQAHKEQRFFLFLHGYDVHGQNDPVEGYSAKFTPGYKGSLKGGKDEQAVFRERGLANKFKRPDHEPGLAPSEFSEADRDFYRGQYDEKIEHADARFGEFLKAMDDMGLADKTIFVLLADHGEEFMEHGNIDHGPTLFQEMIHVPLVIKVPGVPPRRITELVSSFDALPTVLDFLGVKPGRIDGVSLRPLMEGKAMTLPTVFCETDYRLFSHKRAVIVGDLKVIHSLDTDRWVCYDLKADPAEQHPLPVDRAPELRKSLEAWEATLPRRYADYKTDPGAIIKIF